MDACCSFCKDFVLHILFGVGVGFGVIFFGYGLYVMIAYDSFDLNTTESWPLVWVVSLIVGLVVALLEALSIAILCSLVSKCEICFHKFCLPKRN